jgi:hypothetical protein
MVDKLNLGTPRQDLPPQSSGLQQAENTQYQKPDGTDGIQRAENSPENINYTGERGSPRPEGGSSIFGPTRQYNNNKFGNKAAGGETGEKAGSKGGGLASKIPGINKIPGVGKKDEKDDGSNSAAPTPLQRVGKFFGRNKASIAFSAVGLAGSVAMFFISSILSGPVQFIQAAAMLADAFNTGKEVMMDARLLRNTASILKNGHNSKHDSFSRRRLGPMANRVVDSMANRMSKKGITANTLLGANKGVSVDYKKMTGDELPDSSSGRERSRKRIANEFGVPEEKVSIRNGKVHVDMQGMKKAEKKAFAKALNTFTGNRFRVFGAIQERLFLRRIGATFGMHIFDRARTALIDKASNKIATLIERQMKDATKTRVIGDHKAKEEAEAKKSHDAGDTTVDEYNKKLNEIDGRYKKGGEKVAQKATKELVSETITRVASKANLIALILDISCMIHDVLDGSENWRTMLLSRSVDGAIRTSGIADQIKAVQLTPEYTAAEVTMGVIGTESQIVMGRDVKIEEDSGGTETVPSSGHFDDDNEVSTDNTASTVTDAGTYYDSYWDSAYASQFADGTIASDEKKVDTTPPGLGIKGGLVNKIKTLPYGIGDAIYAVFTNPALDGVCFLYNNIMATLFKPVEWVLTGVMSKLMEEIPGFKNLMDTLGKLVVTFMYGGEFYPDELLPSSRGTSDAAGKSVDRAISVATMGATEVSDTAFLEVNRETEEYLAEQYSEKSFFAKLFDPEDYRSGIAVLSRKAKWNTTTNTFETHLANVFKTFAAIPQLAMSTIGSISTAYADDGMSMTRAHLDLNADMGIRNFDWSQEMRDLLNPDEEHEMENCGEKETAVVEGESKEVCKESIYDIAPNDAWINAVLDPSNADNAPVTADTDDYKKDSPAVLKALEDAANHVGESLAVINAAKDIWGIKLNVDGTFDSSNNSGEFCAGNVNAECEGNSEPISVTTDSKTLGNGPTKFNFDNEIHRRLAIYLFDFSMSSAGDCAEGGDCDNYELEAQTTDEDGGGSGATGSIVAGTAQEIAQMLLDNTNISLTDNAKADLKEVIKSDDGSVSVCNDRVKVQLRPDLLGMIQAASETWHMSINFIRGHSCNGKSHFQRGGAVDLNWIYKHSDKLSHDSTGTNTAAFPSEADKSLLVEFGNDLKSIVDSSANASSINLRIAQLGADGKGNSCDVNGIAGIQGFTDTCNHIHVDMNNASGGAANW